MKISGKIKEYASLITALTVVIGVMWGAFRYIDNTSTQANTLDEIKDAQRAMTDSLATLSKRVADLTLVVEAVGENNILIGNYVEKINRALVLHLQNSPEVTKNDYAALIDLINEVKKNN